MKNITKPALFILLVVIVSAIGCSKSGDTKPKTPTNNLSALEGSWYNNDWGGVSGNYTEFSIDDTTATGIVTLASTMSYNFNIGDKMFTNIVYKSAGVYTAQGKYTYGTDNSSTGMRAVNITLQNNNTQLTADYPALNADYPEIIYVFQQGTIHFL